MLQKYNLGKKGELYVIEVLQKCGLEAELNNNYQTRYDYDIISRMDDRKFTIEVKHDVMATKTNNIAIEYHNSKKDTPSGICATSADIWVHLVPQENGDIYAYAISVKRLKEITGVEDLTTTPIISPHKHVKNKGDANSNMLIYRIENILHYFIRIDAISNKKILESILEGMLND